MIFFADDSANPDIRVAIRQAAQVRKEFRVQALEAATRRVTYQAPDEDEDDSTNDRHPKSRVPGRTRNS